MSQEIRDTLEEVMRRLRVCCASGRFTRTRNLHLTLVFLGEHSSERLAAIRDSMEAVRTEPFILHVGGFGYFKREGGNIFWAGVERSEPLLTLHRQLTEELQSRDFRVESRVFRPHLTLARQAVLKQEYDHGAFVVPAVKMQVCQITLFQSERLEGKLCYTPVYEKLLLKE